jgi:hypothetical protein
VRPRGQTMTPEIGTRSPTDGTWRVRMRRHDSRGCVLAIVWGIARSEPDICGTACDAHCMRRVQAPTLALDSPPNHSLFVSLDSRLYAFLSSQHRIFPNTNYYSTYCVLVRFVDGDTSRRTQLSIKWLLGCGTGTQIPVLLSAKVCPFFPVSLFSFISRNAHANNAFLLFSPSSTESAPFSSLCYFA